MSSDQGTVTVDEVPAGSRYALPRRPADRRREITWAGDEDPATFHLAARTGDDLVGVVPFFSPPPARGRPDARASWQLGGWPPIPPAAVPAPGQALLAKVPRQRSPPGWRPGVVRRPRAGRRFYERFGFTVVTEPFDKPGIGPHVGMLIESARQMVPARA